MRDAIDYRIYAFAAAAIRQQHRLAAAHRETVTLHTGHVSANVRSKIDLIDEEKIAVDDPGPALARNIVAIGDVDPRWLADRPE